MGAIGLTQVSDGVECCRPVSHAHTWEGAHRAVTGPTTILVDSSAMHDLVAKEGSSSRSRHFERCTVLIKFAIMRPSIWCQSEPWGSFLDC